MEYDRRRDKRLLRTFVICALGLTLIAPAVAAREKKGVDVVVMKKDGTIVQGELLAVRGENLLLIKVFTNEGLTESLREISMIKVVRKNKFTKGLGRGFLYGALGGAVLGAAVTNETSGGGGLAMAAIGGIYIGGIGALIGGIAGALAPSDEVIAIEKTDAIYLAGISSKLRRMARDRS